MNSPENIIPILQGYADSPIPIIRDSVILAIDKIKETCQLNDLNGFETKQNSSENIPFSKFGSRDPAYPMKGTIEQTRDKFVNGNICEKYKAMFYLRDLNSKESVDILGGELIKKVVGTSQKVDGHNANFIIRDNSIGELLRHEIAYVFGQMENEHSVKYLKAVLEDDSEADVVRHEAAEALGNIGNDECVNILKKESCEVGLKIAELDEDQYFEINQ
ncbi:unnamed protein product [Medioppia subpectinata]|uniref:Deoxyhypusine monooxygenase n=1 Tax=Medioppia subpectinata TaxID=1979941 RepID=A0A7R9PTR6_9ACAR|nr:unnamed protein product [Medioppia subpectinata]CAG2100731.1 unnamed protein product [Medioppia subpectinata]